MVPLTQSADRNRHLTNYPRAGWPRNEQPKLLFPCPERTRHWRSAEPCSRQKPSFAKESASRPALDELQYLEIVDAETLNAATNPLYSIRHLQQVSWLDPVYRHHRARSGRRQDMEAPNASISHSATASSCRETPAEWRKRPLEGRHPTSLVRAGVQRAIH